LPARAEIATGNGDDREIKAVVETFRQLVSQLSRDGNELTDLYVKAERRAATYARLSATVVETVSSGIIVVDGSGDIRLVNSSARRILGIERSRRLVGNRLESLFGECGQLLALSTEDIQRCRNSSRKMLKVRTLDGVTRSIGASTSCVTSVPQKVDALIIVFTELSVFEAERADGGTQSDDEYHGYLRGVLDSYDLISGLAGRADLLLEGRDHGPEELSRLYGELRRACDLMMAMALPMGIASSVSELVDLEAVLRGVVKRSRELRRIRLRTGGGSPLPRVKSVRKVLEAGLELLLAGCSAASGGHVEASTRLTKHGGSDWVCIEIRERRVTPPLGEVGYSLRAFAAGGDLRREAGLLLLRALPPEGHLVEAEKPEGLFVFRVGMPAPIKRETGHSTQKGDLGERGMEEE
jgi:PAS domain-containing protein